jgi:hypothetical protein
MVCTILDDNNENFGLHKQNWEKIFYWICLACFDENSVFSRLPVEVVFNFAGLSAKLPRR